MAYPRKSSYTRLEIKTLLGANAVFAALSDSAKNIIIDNAVQKVASLRNSLGHEDFQADTVTTGAVIAPVQSQVMTTSARVALGATLGLNDTAWVVDSDLKSMFAWDGTEWV